MYIYMYMYVIMYLSFFGGVGVGGGRGRGGHVRDCEAEKCKIVKYCRLVGTYKSTDRRIAICLIPATQLLSQS